MATLKSKEWSQGGKEDELRLEQAKETGTFEFRTSWVSRRTIVKQNRSPEEIHDMRIMYEYDYEYLQQEKTEIGPERRQVEN